MNFTGLIIAVTTFLVIGLFHPIVIKSEYHFGTKCWWAFALTGIIFIAASLAVENGILTGYGDGVLGTADPVTREQLAVFLYRYARLQGLDGTAGTGLSGFADSGEVSPWAAEAMAWAVDKGLICGTSAATLSPSETATRAQMAVILSRWLETA